METKKIICLYGGPGTGKSTTCAGLFYNLKIKNYNCEMNREYVKEWVWEGRPIQGGDQTYFFSKQARVERIFMNNGLDFIITDSPLILTHFYGMKYDEFEQMSNTSLMMLKNHHTFCKKKGYKVDHFFLNRTKPFNQSGRNESEEVAKLFDTEMKTLLNEMNIKFIEINADENAVDNIIEVLNVR